MYTKVYNRAYVGIIDQEGQGGGIVFEPNIARCDFSNGFYRNIALK